MGVWSDTGDQFLGKLESSFLGLNATGVMNEVLFQTNTGVCCDRSIYCAGCVTEFSLISNGVTLACVRKSNDRSVGAEISLFNSRNMDSRTKALLIFAGYYLVSQLVAFESIVSYFVFLFSVCFRFGCNALWTNWYAWILFANVLLFFNC